MNDLQAWQRAQTVAWECYEGLPACKRQALDSLIERIMHLKENLLKVALAGGSSQICAECGGKCCLYGKYHVSMLDLIIYRKFSPEPLVPNFSAYPFCPYGSADGCCFAPGFRPVTCVIFNCDLIEERLAEDARHQAVQYEHELREACAGAEMMTESRLTRAALLSCETI